MSEAYYVISGDGSVTVDGETVAIRSEDAIPVDLGQSKSFTAGYRAAGIDGGRHCAGFENEGGVCGGGGKRELTKGLCRSQISARRYRRT
jgi:hypothetical protein